MAQVRLLKTAKTIDSLHQEPFSHLQAWPGAPWSLAQALDWSHKGLVVYWDGNEVIGLALDTSLPPGQEDLLTTWGWQVTQLDKNTVLLTKTETTLPAETERYGSLWLLVPFFDGEIILKGQNGEINRLPWRFNSDKNLKIAASLSSYTPKTELKLAPDTQILALLSFPGATPVPWLPQNLPATFPGLGRLADHLSEHGGSLALGKDSQGPVLLLSTANPGLSLEELGETAQESLYLQSLSTLELTLDELGTATEIRSELEINLDFTQSDTLQAVTASVSDGQIFRLNQANNALIISNRAPMVGSESASLPNDCVKNPHGFIQPSALIDTLPGTSELAANGSLSNFLTEIETIAWRKNWLTLCF